MDQVKPSSKVISEPLQPPATASASDDGLTRAVQAADFKAVVLDARKDVLEHAYTRLEIEIAFLGLLLTVMVLFFALRAEKAAKSAARDEIAKERANIADLVIQAAEDRQRITAHVEDVQAETRSRINLMTVQLGEQVEIMIAEADHILDRLKNVDSEIRERRDAFIAYISQRIASRGSVTDQEEDAIRHALAIAISKDEQDRDVQDFHVLMATAAREANWWEVGKLARELTARFPDNHDARSASLFYLGVSFGSQRFEREAVAAYDMLIADYGTNAHPAIVSRIARARFNRARLLDAEPAIEAFSEFVRLYAGDDNPEHRSLANAAMLNKAVRFSKLRKFDEAIALNRRLIEALAQATSDREAAIVNDAWYNLGCAHARTGDVTATLTALKSWRQRTGFLHSDLIAVDDAFDAIRKDASFVAFLASTDPADRPNEPQQPT